MIDASPSLEAAKGISGRDLLAYLSAEGWTAGPSKVDGIMILSKEIAESDQRAEFIIPIKAGFKDEERRIADALRAIAQIQGRSEAQIAKSVRQVAGHKSSKPSGILTRALKENLEKVVQHGKRADTIVKNMLLHSRQGSGEHRPVDVNVLVEESLNLAYHGARAEKQGFNITLKRSFDPNAGEIDVFPQEIARVLLNLISNGFYAATKRKAQVEGDGYEPTLAAATKNLGDSVEIRIRDSGAGIPPEVKEKMFNPFFTTKPAGEGTGLGLSLSYDIVVKQHGGSIEVDTQPGEFTEFKVILPRMAATGKAGANK
jgi:two-component system NtrC family sensor kinase